MNRLSETLAIKHMPIVLYINDVHVKKRYFHRKIRKYITLKYLTEN